MDLTRLFDKIRLQDGFESGELIADDEDVKNIEKSLDVRLPNEYVKFLNVFGYIDCDAFNIYGFSSDQLFDVVSNTEKARAEELPEDFLEFPRNCVVIMKYGGGGYYILYCKDSPRAGQVSLILDETFYEEDESWESFASFIYDWLE